MRPTLHLPKTVSPSHDPALLDELAEVIADAALDQMLADTEPPVKDSSMEKESRS